MLTRGSVARLALLRCPPTEGLSEWLLRLPYYNDLSEPEQQRIAERIFTFRGC